MKKKADDLAAEKAKTEEIKKAGQKNAKEAKELAKRAVRPSCIIYIIL